MKKIDIKKLVISILIPVVLGFVVGLITNNSMESFNNLIKPKLSPPGILFPIVWTILYTLMGISSYLIGNSKCKTIYYFQLFFNLFWSIIFFSFELRLIAFLWILVLIYLVVKMIICFYKENKTAAYLQIPYLLWLLFAAYLNLSIYLLN